MKTVFSGKFLITLGLISFVFIATFGLLFSVSNNQHIDLTSFRCVDQSSCPTAIFEHIEHWQQAFLFISPDLLSIVAIIMFLGAVLAFVIVRNIELLKYIMSRYFGWQYLIHSIRLLTGTVQSAL